MADYGEIFCQAVDAIIKEKLNSLTYDITKNCIVTSTKYKSENRYTVSDGSSSFEAVAAAGSSYVEGDQVLVTVPQGDYSQQKVILNKVIKNSTPIGYESPLDTFIKGTNNLCNNNISYGIKANGDVALHPVANVSNAFAGFTHIALTAKFMALLDNYDLSSGDYGLKLLAYDGNKVVEFNLSTQDMLGNPYVFNTYFYQEIVFELPEHMTKITGLQVLFYQNGNFTNNKNELIDPASFNNILVKGIEVYLGFASSETASEIFSISTNELKYKTHDTNRKVELQWFHCLDDGGHECINKDNWEQFESYCEIRWYQHAPGCSEAETDEYGGKNWKLLNPDNQMKDAKEEEYPFIIPVKLATNKTTEQIKAIGLYYTYPLVNAPDHKTVLTYVSNILEFENTTEDNNGGELTDEQLENILSLHFDDGSYGNYFLYNQNNVLIDSYFQSKQNRSVSLYAYDTPITDYPDIFDTIDWIRWEVSAANTMILPLKEMINPNKELIEADGIVNYGQTGQFIYRANFTDAFIAQQEQVSKPEDEIVKIIITVNINPLNDEEIKTISLPVIQELANFNLVNRLFSINRQYNSVWFTYAGYNEEGEMITEEGFNPFENISLKQPSSFTMLTLDKGNIAPDDDEDKSTLFPYLIETALDPSKNNNIIRCIVSINNTVFELSETLRFGKKGTSGTQYTFILEMLDGKNGLCVDDEDKTLKVRPLLIGGNGKVLNMSGNGELECGLIYGHNTISQSGPDENGIITLSTSSSVVPTNNFTILYAGYSGVEDSQSGTSPKLYAFLPIPMKSVNCFGIQGPTQIIYNHQGIPNYGTDVFMAFSDQGVNNNWNCTQPPFGEKDLPNPNPITLQYVSSPESGYRIVASPLYCTQTEGENNSLVQDRVCVYCSGLWSQPILIMQSSYDFAMLNEWDGSILTDEVNGAILATMLGAGKKDRDNKFSGVLMGDVRSGTGLESAVTQTGVYGFDKGIMSYGFKEDGTAFLGKYGNGRIEFDGTKGIIKSAGWIKPKDQDWKLNDYQRDADGNIIEDENGNKLSEDPNVLLRTSGTLIDLDDGLLLMQSKDNYLKFNRDIDKDGNRDGLLEMKLSGLNLILTDKKNNPGISAYIDQSAYGLIREFRRTAAYYATCDTESYFEKVNSEYQIKDSDNKCKEILLTNFDYFYESEDQGIKALTEKDIMQQGITIAVKFTNEELVKQIVTYDKDDYEVETIPKLQQTGTDLYITIKDKEENIYSRPIYINNMATSEDNPFGWAKGSVLYFTYNGTFDEGEWHLTDSGSYSRITQSADLLRSDIGQIGGNLSSSITQTANKIQTEVRRYAGYFGVCNTKDSQAIKDEEDDQDENFAVKKVYIKNGPEFVYTDEEKNSNFRYNKILQDGIGLAVQFNQKQSQFDNTKGICLQLINEKDKTEKTSSKPIKLINDKKFEWNYGDTVYFIYDGDNESWEITDAGSYSRITQTADAITAEVRRTATYYGTSDTASDNAIKEVSLINALKGNNEPISDENLYQNGITIAVTFEHKEKATYTCPDYKENGNPNADISRTGRTLSLLINDDNKPIYINGSETNKDNSFEWVDGATVYFVYRTDAMNGHWEVADSGGYSNITQTADSIRTTVANLNNSLSTQILQTKNEISLSAARKANYYCICEDDEDSPVCKIVLNNQKDSTLLMEAKEKGGTYLTDIISDAIFTITFNNGNKVRQTDPALDVIFKIYNTQGTECIFEGTLSGSAIQDQQIWLGGETLSFIYNTTAQNFTMTSISSGAIQITADQIQMTVGQTANYYCTCSTNNATKIKIIEQLPLNFHEEMKAGCILLIRFTNGNTYGEDEVDRTLSFKFDYGNGIQSPNTYAVTGTPEWEGGETLAFLYNGTSFVMTSISNSTFTIIDNRISAEVQGKLGSTGEFGSCGWSITTDGFRIYKIAGGVPTDLFSVDIYGNAYFAGNLTAEKTSFNKIISDPVKINGQEYYSSFTKGELRLVVGNPDGENDTNGTGGELVVGDPNFKDTSTQLVWDDVTIYANLIHEHVDQYDGYGNIGTPTKKWNKGYFYEHSSKREYKKNIQPYNNQQAYDELRNIPLYTYNYLRGDSAQILYLGTMIDYMPNEFMSTTSTNDGTMFEPNNIMFWTIGASQVMQSKLENLIERVEKLEQEGIT